MTANPRSPAVPAGDGCGNCAACDYCARMTPALIALANVPRTNEELIPPDPVIAAVLEMFPGVRRREDEPSSDLRRG